MNPIESALWLLLDHSTNADREVPLEDELYVVCIRFTFGHRKVVAEAVDPFADVRHPQTLEARVGGTDGEASAPDPVHVGPAR